MKYKIKYTDLDGKEFYFVGPDGKPAELSHEDTLKLIPILSKVHMEVWVEDC